MTLVLTRGILNHNPCNLNRIPNKPWNGEMVKVTPHDDRFAQFTTAEWGLRAAVLNFQSGQTLHGCKTWRDLINRQAPPIENNTDAYVDTVANVTGYNMDDPCDTVTWSAIQPFVAACVLMENGSFTYPDNVWAATKTLLAGAVK